MDDHREPNRGTVLSVRGSVVDARFPGRLPDFHSELRAGDDREIVIEVVSHLDPETVRGVALTPTAGLSRGAGIIDSGHPLRVPVGPAPLWVPPVVTALGPDGAVLATVRLTGAPLMNLDWEALAVGPGPDGEPWVHVGDVGDNLGVRPTCASTASPNRSCGTRP